MPKIMKQNIRNQARPPHTGRITRNSGLRWMVRSAFRIIDVEKIGAQSWRYTWAEGLSPYSIWYKGILWDRVDATEYIIEETGAANEPPAIEVLDSSPGATAEQELYPPLLILQWRGVDGVDRYQIQEKVFGTWTTRHTVLETGLGYYQYKTPALADVTLAKWRVRAIDEWDNPSAALNFDAFIVSNPEPPAITMTYDSGTGLVTIASA